MTRSSPPPMSPEEYMQGEAYRQAVLQTAQGHHWDLQATLTFDARNNTRDDRRAAHKVINWAEHLMNETAVEAGVAHWKAGSSGRVAGPWPKARYGSTRGAKKGKQKRHPDAQPIYLLSLEEHVSGDRHAHFLLAMPKMVGQVDLETCGAAMGGHPGRRRSSLRKSRLQPDQKPR